MYDEKIVFLLISLMVSGNVFPQGKSVTVYSSGKIHQPKYCLFYDNHTMSAIPDYGERKPLTMDQMKYQLDKYYIWIKKRDIEGIIFCFNCIADIGLNTVDFTRKWIAEVGNEKM